MSIHAINKSTDGYSGGGLPVYEKLDYVFSKLNQGFNSSLGLWQTPNGKVPAFQIFIAGIFGTVTSFVYHETKGENNFTGATFVVTPSAIKVFAGTKDGVAGFWMHTNQDGTMAFPPVNGRWVGFLTVNDAGTPATHKTYYTEEFLTQPCCQT